MQAADFEMLSDSEVPSSCGCSLWDNVHLTLLTEGNRAHLLLGKWWFSINIYFRFHPEVALL